MHKVTLSNQSLNSTVPEWIEILPAGEVVTGRDGRFFIKPDALAIAENTKANGKDIPIDIDHQSIGQGAQGWVKELEVRDDTSIWGRVDWTKEGEKNVGDKSFRYTSPSVAYTPTTEDQRSGVIIAIEAIGLTNNPNFRLQALNHQLPNGDYKMDLKEIARQLGLDENASEAEITAAIEALKAEKPKEDVPAEEPKPAEPPKEDAPTTEDKPAAEQKVAANTKAPEGYVSQDAYNILLQQNAELRVAMNNQQANTQKSIAHSVVDEALKDGRIAPNSKQFWDDCAERLGVDYVKGQLDQMKPLVQTAANHKLNAKPTTTGSGLTDTEKQTAANLGLTEEEFLKAK